MITMKNDATHYGLIGKSLQHSFSKKFFDEKFKNECIAAIYHNFELSSLKEFPGFLKKHPEIKGLNVTIPYKTEIIPYLDGLSETAKEIGAVNVIEFSNNKLIGHNTDAFGFQQAIKPFLRNIHERALILGTGGASKAVAYVLNNLGIDVAYLSRDPQGGNAFSYDEANEYMVKAFKLVINCTPLGTFPNVDEIPNYPVELVGEDHFVIDLIYNPNQTLLLKLAADKKADTMNGLSMLKHQAIKAWEIWNS
ncbi:MAG: shikimate dehydrogenase [Brumimicrobium sp.]